VGVGGELDILCRLNNIAESNAQKFELHTEMRFFKLYFAIDRCRTKYNSTNSMEGKELHAVVKNLGYYSLGEW